MLSGGAYSQDSTFAFAATLGTPPAATARRAVYRRGGRADDARRPPSPYTLCWGSRALRSYLSRCRHRSCPWRLAQWPHCADHRPADDLVHDRAAFLQLRIARYGASCRLGGCDDLAVAHVARHLAVSKRGRWGRCRAGAETGLARPCTERDRPPDAQQSPDRARHDPPAGTKIDT